MWHEFKIKTVDKGLLDIGVQNMDDSTASIRLDSIMRYYSTKEDDDEDATIIVFDYGDQMLVYHHYNEVKQIMKEYADSL